VRRTARFLAVLCIIAVLAAALLAPSSGGSSACVLVPLAPLFGLVVLPPAPAPDPVPSWSFVPSGPRPSRAPPAIV